LVEDIMRGLLPVSTLLTCLTVSGLYAEIICSPNDYRGTYAFYARGFFVDLPPEAAALAGPFAQAGTFTSDGLGNLIIESTPSFNGIIFPSAEPATYEINSDCTLTVDVVLPIVEVSSRFFGVLSSGNRQMNLTVVDPPGTVIVGQHAKQDLRFCGLEDFSGAYQIDLTGARVPPLDRPGPFHRSGRLVADGEGGFTAWTIANYAGAPVAEGFDGTYTVNARCAIEVRYSHQGEEFQIIGNLAGHGENVAAMVAVPGWSVAGSLRRQQ
jgi:hypothetical protein